MDQTRAKLRNRHRWLIAAVLLFTLVASLVSWWNWPRVDQRFLGKWYHSNPVAIAPIEFTVELLADGSGTIWEVNHDVIREADMITTSIRWWFRDDNLLFLRPGTGSPSAMDRTLSALGVPFSGRPSLLRIVQVTERQIHWRRRSENSDSTLLVLERVE